ncbi:type II secretion system F family protein [Shimia ponticola]|uniref:type II secretion system F family protein n=1 Tax=Shimia ponticola TaxID=2582893 RepID=UPI0011BE2C0A|nr:type II secretion system F family protein [Shimia ponticola]
MTGALILLVAAVVVFVALGLLMLIHADRTRQMLRARLDRGKPVVTIDASDAPTKERAAPHGVLVRLEAELARTALKATVNEVLLQVALGTLGLYGLMVLFSGVHPVLAVPVAVGMAIGAAVLVLRAAQSRYRAAFTEALPETMDVFVRGLRAGRPIVDSLGIVVDTVEGPAKTEFARCHGEIAMGTDLPTSLARMEQRLRTPEVSFFAVATALQAENGGNLIETMENLSNQLRERRKLRKKARALTSEARASATILAALPFAVFAAISLLNWRYIEPLYSDPRGQVMAAIAIAGVAFGVFVMVRMGKIHV